MKREELENEYKIKVEFDEEGNPTIYHFSKQNQYSKGCWKIIKQSITCEGYIRISIFHKGKTQLFLVHRLVYAWIHGECSNGMHIDHIDGNRLNNKPSNLQELTPQDNMAKRCAPQAVEENKILKKRIKYLESLLDKEGIEYEEG